MPSGSINFKGSLILYQCGLGDNHYSLLPLIDNVVLSNSRKNIAYPGYIDFTSFLNGAFNSIEKQDEVLGVLDNLAAFCNSTVNKNVHARTLLSSHSGYESLESQAERLTFIINYLIDNKKIDRRIVLIGHGQGGLINLMSAIDVPTKIKKMISIATPYTSYNVSKNYLALIELARNRFSFELSPYNKDRTSLFNESTTEMLERSLSTLGNQSFYNDLKDKWCYLPSKPKLTVITTSSGLLSSSGWRSFDGVLTSETQHSVPYDKCIHIIPNNIHCLNDKCNALGGRYKNRCKSCKHLNGTCILPKFVLANPVNAIWNSLLTEVGKWLIGKGFKDESLRLELNKLVQTFNEIEDSLSLTHESHRPLYDILIGPYSHYGIRYNRLVSFAIRSEIE